MFSKADLKTVGLVALGATLAIVITGIVNKQLDKAKTSAPVSTASTAATTAAPAAQ